MEAWSVVRVALVVLVCFSRGTASADIDNGVTQTPTVECKEDSIEFNFTTRKPFKGRVFVKGRSDDPMCSSDFTGEGRGGASIVIQLGACGMQRIRSVAEPAGMNMLVTLVITFHPIFITKVDKAYNVRCLFRPQMRTLTQSLDISMMPTDSIGSDGDTTSCTYSIRHNTTDGPIIRHATVGDTMVHVWECDAGVEAADRGMLVHSCQTSDVGGRQLVEIIDSKGCLIDPVLLEAITYESSPLRAYARSHAYKYADKSSITFTCSIQVCSRASGECDVLTPPHCPIATSDPGNVLTAHKFVARARRPVRSAVTLARRSRTTVEPAGGERFQSVDVTAEEILVFDPDTKNSLTDNVAESDGEQEAHDARVTERIATSIKKTSSKSQPRLREAEFRDRHPAGSVTRTSPSRMSLDSNASTNSKDSICLPASQFAVMASSTLLAFVLATVVGVVSFAKAVSRLWAQSRPPPKLTAKQPQQWRFRDPYGEALAAYFGHA